MALSQADLEFIDYTEAVDMTAFAAKNMVTGEMWDSESACSGKRKLLEFYFNGCPACNENAQNVARLAREAAGACVVEVSIDCDEWKYQEWIRKHKPRWPVLNDCDGAIAGTARASRYPTTVILDPDYKEAMRSVGVWSERTYRRIAEYMKGN